MKEANGLKYLTNEEALIINGGECSCPDCGGGLVGRAIGRFIKFWATANYARVPIA